MPNYKALAVQFARKYGIDPNAFVRQINAESNFNPNVTSGAGAQGIAQIMPSTARGWGVNPHNPVQSLEAAAAHMAQYQKQTGSLKGALEMYNLGHTAPDGQLPAETRNYIAKIAGGRGSSVSPSPSPGRVSGQAGPVSPGSPAARALAMQMLGMNVGGGGGDPLMGILSKLAGKQSAPAAPASSPVTSSTPTGPGGVTNFDGKPVDTWIAGILAQARATGLWKGSVNSGYRSRAKQASLYQNYLHGGNIAAKPGQSNHEFNAYPGGAVDVSDPQGLNKALQHLGVNKLKWAVTHGLADQPHFSSTGH